jgi:hypothetical protein
MLRGLIHIGIALGGGDILFGRERGTKYGFQIRRQEKDRKPLNCREKYHFKTGRKISIQNGEKIGTKVKKKLTQLSIGEIVIQRVSVGEIPLR